MMHNARGADVPGGPARALPGPVAQAVIRPATIEDIDNLVRIETNSFETDRLSARSFRYLLSKANALTLVAAGADDVAQGYVMVLFNRGTSLARLYSIAVDPDVRGIGLGERLLRAAEAGAREHETACMRLEVRADDPLAQSFYRGHGYRQFAVHHHYYEDRADALRMEKSLAPRPDPSLARVPYYAQSLDFTCGPAAALMAMRALNPDIEVDQTAELRLWRESTTVFMTSGVGGCSPEGLALAVHRRGFQVELFLSDTGILFVELGAQRQQTRGHPPGPGRLSPSADRGGYPDHLPPAVGRDHAREVRSRRHPLGADQLVPVRPRKTAALGRGHWLRRKICLSS